MAGNTDNYKEQGGAVWVVGGELRVASGGTITAAGTQASHIADADVAHDVNSTFSDTEVEAALDALGGKINSILAALEGAGILASS